VCLRLVDAKRRIEADGTHVAASERGRGTAEEMNDLAEVRERIGQATRNPSLRPGVSERFDDRTIPGHRVDRFTVADEVRLAGDQPWFFLEPLGDQEVRIDDGVDVHIIGDRCAITDGRFELPAREVSQEILDHDRTFARTPHAAGSDCRGAEAAGFVGIQDQFFGSTLGLRVQIRQFRMTDIRRILVALADRSIDCNHNRARVDELPDTCLLARSDDVLRTAKVYPEHVLAHFRTRQRECVDHRRSVEHRVDSDESRLEILRAPDVAHDALHARVRALEGSEVERTHLATELQKPSHEMLSDVTVSSRHQARGAYPVSVDIELHRDCAACTAMLACAISMSRLRPLVIEDSDHEPWDDTADLVVVGMGAAGVSAALEASELGLEVVGLDRFEGGGAASISGGVFYAGGGTHIQQAAGVTDSVEDMYRYLSIEVQDAVTDRTLRHFCESSAETVKWLTDRGVPFYGTLCPVKTSYPTNEYHLYFSGNECFPPYAQHATPAPRGHRTDGGAFPGANLIRPLWKNALERGVRVGLQKRVERLIVDKGGRVVGAQYREISSRFWRWWHALLHRFETAVAKALPSIAAKLRSWCTEIEDARSRPKRVRSRCGVVLCAGGFVFNRAMLRKHAPRFMAGLPLGTAGDDGLGIRLGQSVGGRVSHMERVSAWRFLYPPNAFSAGMLVNRRGERFANELWYGAKIGEAMVEGNDGIATLIIDRHLRKLARVQSRRGELQWFQRVAALVNLHLNCRKAKDVPSLARLLDVPTETLERTFDEYNSAAEGKSTDRFGKEPNAMHAMREGPFFAIDCSLGSRRHVCAVMTLGGLVVDEATGGVLGDGGNTIPGLYAAGRNAVGICSRQYVSGLSIADSVYSGRRAGRHAAGAFHRELDQQPETTRVPPSVS